MKRVLFLILAVLLVLPPLAGCDLEDAQESEYFFPTDTYNWYSRDDTSPIYDPGAASQKNVVKTVQTHTGEIPLTTPTRTYSYELPFIDLAGSHAASCNQDIENFFGTLIRQSLDAMERYEDPILERLSYSTFEISGILTLRVNRRDCDGEESQAWYTVDAETGEAVSVARLFAAAGISGDPAAVVNDAALARFTSRYGALQGSDAAHTTAWNRTQGALSPLTANRMHLNANGSLTVAFELFAPDGGSSIVELTLP